MTLGATVAHLADLAWPMADRWSIVHAYVRFQA